MSRSLVLKILFNTCFGVVAIVIWLQFVNIKDILNTISKINLWYLAPIFFTIWLSIAIRSYKLKVFLSTLHKVDLLNLVSLNGVATMLNFLIPIRAGEISKGIYLSRKYGIPAGRSVVWIFLDRFIDFLVLLIFTPFLLLLITNNLSIQVVALITLLSLSLTLISYLMVYQKKFATKLFEFCTHFLVFSPLKKYFTKIYIHFLDSFEILRRSPKDLSYLFFVALLAFASDSATWFFCFLSLGSYQWYIKMFLAQFLSAVTYVIPAAPGYVGSAEASALIVFSGILGINANLASSMTIVYHSSIAIFIILYGVFCFYLLKLNPEDLFKKVLKKEES